MSSLLRLPSHLPAACAGVLFFLFVLLGSRVSAQMVTLHLKNGDQITGRLVSENTNQVVISNAWVRALSIPCSEITRRQTLKAVRPPVAPAKPRTSAAPAAPHRAVAKVSAPLKRRTHPKGTWHGQANVGLDAVFSTVESQDYSGSLHLVYTRPYASDPKEFFRNTTDLHAEYQRTDGQESANRAHGSNKSDFDLGRKIYGYGLVGAGYDDVQRVDFEYQLGPGGGIHIIQHPHFTLNAEGGLDYEAQYRRNASELQMWSVRLAQDATWHIRKNMTLSENEAFYPDMNHTGQFRNTFSSTLSYGFWKALSLNLTVSDNYNSEVLPGVDPNQFEVRSSLGFTF